MAPLRRRIVGLDSTPVPHVRIPGKPEFAPGTRTGAAVSREEWQQKFGPSIWIDPPASSTPAAPSRIAGMGNDPTIPAPPARSASPQTTHLLSEEWDQVLADKQAAILAQIQVKTGADPAPDVSGGSTGLPPMPNNWRDNIPATSAYAGSGNYTPPPGSLNMGASGGGGFPSGRIAGLGGDPLDRAPHKPANSFEIDDPWAGSYDAVASKGDRSATQGERQAATIAGLLPAAGGTGGGSKPPTPPRVVGDMGDLPEPNKNRPYNGPPQQLSIPGYRTPEMVGGLGQQIRQGLGEGWNYSHDKSGFARSAIWHRAPKDVYQDLTPVERAGFAAGRVAGDVVGEGSRSLLWRIQPEDVVGTKTAESLDRLGLAKPTQATAAKTATLAMALGAGNLALNNLGEAGRPEGFAATEADPNDPRKTTNVPLEYINRAVLGRTGRLLPWDQFHAEKPDVDYDAYQKYQEYLKDSGPAFGIVKGTWDGIDGPEVRVAGYRLTPGAVLAPLAVVGGAMALARKGVLR
jgi:hypothetical protein